MVLLREFPGVYCQVSYVVIVRVSGTDFRVSWCPMSNVLCGYCQGFLW